MALTKQAVVDTVTISSNGILLIRFQLQTVQDGNVLSYVYHRTSLRPGDSLDNLMVIVNHHLNTMGWSSVVDIAQLQAIVAIVQTPAVIAAFQSQP